MLKTNPILIFFIEYFPYNKNNITGGIEIRYWAFAKYLSKDYDIKIITTSQKTYYEYSEKMGYEVHRICYHKYTNFGNVISRFKYAWKSYFYCIKKFKSLKVHTILGGCFITYIPSYLAAKKLKAKAIADFHETWRGEWIKNKGIITGILGEIWERIALKLNWDKILSVSEFTKNKLLKQGISEQKIICVFNGIYPIRNINKHNYYNTHFNILSIGRMIYSKRIDLIISIIPKLKKTIPNIQYHIIGSGIEEKNLKIQVAKLNIRNNVIFHGFTDNKTKENIMQNTTLFISASNVEGFGIVLVEALSYGIPLVVSDITPHREINIENKTGYFFKPNDASSLEEKILYFYHLSEKKKKNLIQNTSKNIDKYYWGNIIKKLKLSIN